MRHLALPRRPARRAAARRALALHRPRPPSWRRVHRDRHELRASDIVLALLGLTLLGALCLLAALDLIGRVLAPF